MDPQLNSAIVRAQQIAMAKLDRAVEHGEWERFLPAWAKQALGFEVEESDSLEELEETLVPCGC